MTRRIFGSLFGLAPLALAGVAEGKPPDPPDRFDYRGYGIMWTGWKGFPDSTSFCAQWVAYRLDDKVYLYENSGGLGGRFRRGDAFNITSMGPEYWTDINTSEEVKREQRASTLRRLIFQIDQLGGGR